MIETIEIPKVLGGGPGDLLGIDRGVVPCLEVLGVFQILSDGLF